MSNTQAGGQVLRGERFKTTPLMRIAFWCLQVPPLYAGIILLLPNKTFVSGNAYRLMAHIATEPVWAAISLSIPVFAVVAWKIRTADMLSIALMLSGMWHGVIGILILLAFPLSLFPGSLIILAVLNCLLAMRI